MIQKNIIKSSVFLIFVNLLNGCGDGASESDPSARSSSSVRSLSSVSSSISSAISSSSSSSSSVVVLPLIRPVVSGINEGDDFLITWTEANATQYRVLFWPTPNNLIESYVTQKISSISAQDRRDGGTLIIEAYNDQGDSLFSERLQVGAL